MPYLPKDKREPLNHCMQRSDHAICALFRKHHLTKVNIEND